LITNTKLWMGILSILIMSCEDFVDVGIPNHKIVSETVFENDQTAENAMKGIYNQLFNASFSGGWQHSVTVLGGLSSNILQPVENDDEMFREFYQNEISPNSTPNLNMWSSAYNILYLSNSILEGIEESPNITEKTRLRLEGEARFVRAFTYFYLVNFYGEVPLVVTTDYRLNSVVSRNSIDDIKAQILIDLGKAKTLLNTESIDTERTYVNKYV